MIRMGTGFDVHRLTQGRKLILGGVEIPHSLGLEGHSDADVLAHAIADAFLGAAALGDIGVHFPPDNPDFAGADSIKLLEEVIALLKNKGWVPGNVDATILAEKPKLQGHIPQMRANLSAATGLAKEAVSVKATTTEGLGFAGREEGMAAQAVVTIFPAEKER